MIQGAGYKIQDTGYRIQVAGSKVPKFQGYLPIKAAIILRSLTLPAPFALSRLDALSRIMSGKLDGSPPAPNL